MSKRQAVGYMRTTAEEGSGLGVDQVGLRPRAPPLLKDQ